MPLSNQRGESIFGFMRHQEKSSSSDQYMLTLTQARANQLNQWLLNNKFDYFVQQAITHQSRAEIRNKYKEMQNSLEATIYEKNFNSE